MTPAKSSLKKDFAFFETSARLVQLAHFLRKFKKSKKFSSSFVHVGDKSRPSLCTYALTAMKCTKKVCCACKVAVLLLASIKRATKTCNLFCNFAAKRVEKRCCAFLFTTIVQTSEKPDLLQDRFHVNGKIHCDWYKIS